MRPFRWLWPLILSAPYCCPIWKVKSLQSLSLALLSDGRGEPHRCQGKEVSLFSLFELSKEEPGGRSIRAIACYFLPLAPRAFVQSGELGFPL